MYSWCVLSFSLSLSLTFRHTSELCARKNTFPKCFHATHCRLICEKCSSPVHSYTISLCFLFCKLKKKKFRLEDLLIKKNQKLVFGVCISFFSWNRTQTIRFNSITFAFSPFLLFAEKDSDNDLFGRDCSDFNNTFNNLFDASLRRLRLRELTATEMFTSCFEFSLCQLLDLSKKNNNYCKHFLAH